MIHGDYVVVSEYLGGLGQAGNDGTLVTAGGSPDTMGSWAQLDTVHASNLLARDAYSFEITLGNASAVSRAFLIDIGIDPAGGTTYTPIIQLPLEIYGNAAYFPRKFILPMYFPKGCTVGARCQSATASATIRIWGHLYTGAGMPVYTFAELIGVSGSRGTALTDSAGWVTLATSTGKAYDAIIPCAWPNYDAAAWGDGYGRIDYAIEVASVQHIIAMEHCNAGNDENIRGLTTKYPIATPVPAGSKIVVNETQEFTDYGKRVALIGLRKAA